MLVGEYNKVIKYYQLKWQCKMATEESFKADVSSVYAPCSDEGQALKVSA